MSARKKKVMSAKDFTETFDDLPDGAFFAMAEEFGIGVDDFATEYGDEEKDEEE